MYPDVVGAAVLMAFDIAVGAGAGMIVGAAMITGVEVGLGVTSVATVAEPALGEETATPVAIAATIIISPITASNLLFIPLLDCIAYAFMDISNIYYTT